MRHLAAVLAGVTLLVSGCDDGGPPHAVPSVDQGRFEVPAGTGIFRAGANLEPGVYTSRLLKFCDAVVTRTRTFRYDDENPPGVLLREAVTVWNVRRIVVHDGEFLHTYGCPEGWQRQDRRHPVTPDPATVAGGCEILFGRDPIAKRVFQVRANPFPNGQRKFRLLPEKLEALGDVGNKVLGPDARELSNFVYNPPKYREGGNPIPRFADALAALRKACDKS